MLQDIPHLPVNVDAGCGGTSLGSHGREKLLGHHQNIKVEMIATNHKDKPIPLKVCLVIGY